MAVISNTLRRLLSRFMPSLRTHSHTHTRTHILARVATTFGEERARAGRPIDRQTDRPTESISLSFRALRPSDRPPRPKLDLVIPECVPRRRGSTGRKLDSMVTGIFRVYHIPYFVSATYHHRPPPRCVYKAPLRFYLGEINLSLSRDAERVREEASRSPRGRCRSTVNRSRVLAVGPTIIRGARTNERTCIRPVARCFRG